MENSNQDNRQNLQIESVGEELTSEGWRRYTKVMGFFLGIIVLVYGGYWVWENYLNPAPGGADDIRRLEEGLKQMEEDQRNDTYGGKTPQETLDLFIAALEAGDVDLASKYFLLNEHREEWREGLEQAKAEGRIDEIVSTVRNMKPSSRDTSSKNVVEFSIIEDGATQHAAILMLNEFSGLWKIESL